MNRLLAGFFIFLPFQLFSQSQINFDEYFVDSTLRIDYYHTGDAKTEVFSPDKIYKQGTWAGNPNKCIQPFELGIYQAKVIDTVSNHVIYTKGYNSIFAEYQTTGPALNGIKRTFHESVLIPCPKHPVKLVIEKRSKNNLLAPIFTTIIDPSDYHIITGMPTRNSDEVITISNHGSPHAHVDLLILGEGYTSKEKEKFAKDLKYFTNVLLDFEPYKSRVELFNIAGIFAPSEESGTDEPRQGIYRNTRFNSSFNFFDSDRYCLTDDNKDIRDAAACVPYDAILIMVNKERYGGGGIYNWQMVFAIGSRFRDYVFLHEFGHAFAGLADEYYTSDVAYEDIFVPGVEPLEPNITELLDTANIKWKKYLTPGLKIPTEWGKAKFDSLNTALNSAKAEMNKTLVKMKQSGTAKAQTDSIEKTLKLKIQAISEQVDNFLLNHPLRGKVGVFEGANYLSKGYYRSSVNSMMHKFDPADKSYGVVNDQAIISTINYYTEQ
jgi:hypothetical protein